MMRRPRRVHLLLLLFALSVRTVVAQHSYAPSHQHDVLAQLQSHARTATHAPDSRSHAVVPAAHFILLRVAVVFEPRSALEVAPAQPHTSYTTAIPPPSLPA